MPIITEFASTPLVRIGSTKTAIKKIGSQRLISNCLRFYQDLIFKMRPSSFPFTNIAQLIISESGLTKKTKTSEGYDDAEQKIGDYLKNLYDHLNDALTDIDLTTAEERFRELAVGKLGLRRID